MVNPGVIKLISDEELRKVGITDRFEIEDNIGESIHIHYQNIRLDYKVDEYVELSRKMEQITNMLIAVDGFCCSDYDPLFLMTIATWLPYLLRVEEDVVNLEDLWVDVRSGTGEIKYEKLKKSRVYRALNGDTNEDDIHAQINSFGNDLEKITNGRRTKDILNSIKDNGYEGKKIVVTKYNRIIDGQHRAASMLYLMGNEKVTVKRLIFDEDIRAFDNVIYQETYSVEEKAKEEISKLMSFCLNKKHIFLYGAGYLGREYYHYLKKNGFVVNGFIQSQKSETEDEVLFGKKIYDVMSFTNKYCDEIDAESYGVVIAFFNCDINFSEVAYWGGIEVYHPKHEYIVMGMRGEV